MNGPEEESEPSLCPSLTPLAVSSPINKRAIKPK